MEQISEQPVSPAEAQATESTLGPRTVTVRVQRGIATITLLISGILLFTHLGHYALWDDEALTALIGDGVWHTGDTTAVHGHNIVAYRDGLLIKGLRDRSSPPLQYYLVAPFVGILGENAWAVRLPMATLGLACVALMLWWLRRDQADIGTRVLFGMALLGNVSFFLYFRQCRYYAPAMFLTVAVAYTYLHAQTRRGIIANSIIWVLLFTANYLAWAAAVAMVAIDYGMWGRKRRRLSPADWAIIALPQLLIGGIVLWTWNPASIDAGEMRGAWLPDRLKLLWWTVRDINSCEYGVGVLILAAPVVAYFLRQIWIIRAFIALMAGIIVVVIFSPQSTTIPGRPQADVRYFCSLIPLCVIVETLTLRALTGTDWKFNGIIVGAVLFYSNLLQAGLLLDEEVRVPIGSTPLRFVKELANPPADPYTAASAWINLNIRDGKSVLVLPRFSTYPLMFHAPKVIYAWQLTDRAKDAAYSNLGSINFREQAAPDYIVEFGTSTQLPHDIQRYRLIAILNVNTFMAYRPELFWRSFNDLPQIKPALDGIKIYQRE